MEQVTNELSYYLLEQYEFARQLVKDNKGDEHFEALVRILEQNDELYQAIQDKTPVYKRLTWVQLLLLQACDDIYKLKEAMKPKAKRRHLLTPEELEWEKEIRISSSALNRHQMIGVMFGWLTLHEQVIRICQQFINAINSLVQIHIKLVSHQNEDFDIPKMISMFYQMLIQQSSKPKIQSSYMFDCTNYSLDFANGSINSCNIKGRREMDQNYCKTQLKNIQQSIYGY